MPIEQTKLSYAAAANAALQRALAERPETILFGEDVALPGGVFGVTKGLHDEFGDRVFDTPISETAMLGTAIGAAITGRRPIVEIMWMDFTLVAFDQLVNQAANVRYVSRGRLQAPMTVRTQQGSQPGACAQHSQSLEALLAHIPGLRVCMPATAQDAYDLLLSAIWCDDPTIVIENRNLYFRAKEEISLGGEVQPVGGSITRHTGDDVTLVTWGAMVHSAVSAADRLASDDIGVEVIDARWINPFDTTAVLASVTRTGRLAIAHEANRTGGFASEVISRVVESGAVLHAPPVRIAAPDVRIPAAPSLVGALVPDASTIEAAVRGLARRGSGR
jgi:acetoin:2,6-dichlorophenolindophenol oxidoreductase subunit beta